jgi:hypothetical protein
VRLKYRDLHIIKHALQQYIQRENPRDGDLVQEENLLKKVEAEARLKHGWVEVITNGDVITDTGK